VLTPEVHSAAAAAFLALASASLAISSWSVTELHSALSLKVRTRALIPRRPASRSYSNGSAWSWGRVRCGCGATTSAPCAMNAAGW
jgi:hypothetical protein